MLKKITMVEQNDLSWEVFVDGIHIPSKASGWERLEDLQTIFDALGIEYTVEEQEVGYVY